MGNKILNMVGLVITLLGASSAFAKTIYFGSAPEIVPVAYGTATILRFEEPVKTIWVRLLRDDGHMTTRRVSRRGTARLA